MLARRVKLFVVPAYANKETLVFTVYSLLTNNAILVFEVDAFKEQLKLLAVHPIVPP